LRFAFNSTKLTRLYTEEKGAHKYPPGVVDAFFEVMSVIRHAKDERDLYAIKGLRYEKLKGHRSHQRSIRLNQQFRLILERQRDEQGRYLLIIEIEDYH
jgi:toxin HigB-1